VGWICGLALAWQFLGEPMFTYIYVLTSASHAAPALPPIDTSTLVTMVIGMLGLGGLRTYEKVVGAS